eukprot:5260928-Pleurochrysis_carterae.AAC.1
MPSLVRPPLAVCSSVQQIVSRYSTVTHRRCRRSSMDRNETASNPADDDRVVLCHQESSLFTAATQADVSDAVNAVSAVDTTAIAIIAADSTPHTLAPPHPVRSVDPTACHRQFLPIFVIL